MTLCFLDKYNRFHPANRLSTFSKIAFQIVFSLNLSTKGRPKYFIGSEPHLQPKTSTNSLMLVTAPTWANLDLPKFIFRPNTTFELDKHQMNYQKLIHISTTTNHSIICKEIMRRHQSVSYWIRHTETWKVTFIHSLIQHSANCIYNYDKQQRRHGVSLS